MWEERRRDYLDNLLEGEWVDPSFRWGDNKKAGVTNEKRGKGPGMTRPLLEGRWPLTAMAPRAGSSPAPTRECGIVVNTMRKD
jgi:hypothetical protein